MEFVKNYKPALKNEVEVRLKPLLDLFKNNSVYVFGYGSLLVGNGWRRRGMLRPPKRKELLECELNGFERGPYGVFANNAYYGVIRNARKRCNGVLAPILDLHDWVNLMRTEMAAGLTSYVNYRVVDVTDEVHNITDVSSLKEPYKVHCVCNRPINKIKVLDAQPAPGYYAYVWRRVKREHSEAFAKKFLKTGGFKDSLEVARWIDKEADHDD